MLIMFHSKYLNAQNYITIMHFNERKKFFDIKWYWPVGSKFQI